MNKLIALAAVAAALAPSAARAAGPVYTSPAGHFSFAAPDGLVPLTAAELTGENGAAAAGGGTPQLYEAGFAPKAVADHHGPRLPLVLVRFVPHPVVFKSFADDYRSTEAKAYAAAAAAHPPGPTTGPTAVDPAAPDVRVDTAAGVVASERRRPVRGGTIVKRETCFVGRDGVAVVEWSGTPAEAAAQLKPMLASFRFEPGFEYRPAADVVVVKPAAHDGRRTAAAVIVWAVALLFLALAVLFFVRARRRAVG